MNKMTLSITKLEELLASKGYAASKYFTFNGFCYYIEIVSLKTAETFLLYIPSKYNFDMAASEGKRNVYKLKTLQVQDGGTISDNYATKPNEIDLQYNVHADIDHSDDFEEHLKSKYKYLITLKDVSEEDGTVIRSIYRQIKRLSLSTINMKYKLAIVYKNYICAIRRDDSVSCFTVKHFSRDNNSKRLLVLIDLESLYENSEKIGDNVKLVRGGVYKILEKNQGNHSTAMFKLIDNKKELMAIPNKSELKKKEYEASMFRLEEMFAVIREAEQKKYMELKLVDGDASTIATLESDMNKTRERERIQKELTKILSLKGEIAKYIDILRIKQETTLLTIDKIMFDNAIMFNTMIDNFTELGKYV